MFQGQQSIYLNMNLKWLAWKIVFYRSEKSGVGHQSRGGSVRLCFSAVGINWGHGWFVWLHLYIFSHCGKLGNFLKVVFCLFYLHLCPTFFPVVQQVQVLLCFITSTVVFHLFHTEILIFHIHVLIWKDIYLRKRGSFWAKSALPNVCLKDVISTEGTNDNQPKSKPLGSKLQQRALWAALCQTFKPVWEAVLKRTTFKPEVLGAIKLAN